MRSSTSVSRSRLWIAASVETLRVPRVGLMTSAGFLAPIALLLTVDARRNSLAVFDRSLIDAVQRVELPYLATAVEFVNAVTSSIWAVILWAVTLLTLQAIRWWTPMLAVLVMPWGGFFNNLIGVLIVVRTRPDGNGLLRTIGDWDASSFPGGHVVGAVMLCGFLIYLAPRIRIDALRVAVVGLSLVIITTVGIALIMLVEQIEWTIAVLARRFHLPNWLKPLTTRG